MTSWHSMFMGICDVVSSKSKDPSTRVGCVIVAPDRSVRSTGFNGLPRRIADTPERLNNREMKIALTVHGELNAILASRGGANECSLYVNSLPPCVSCATAIIQSGIQTVYFPYKPIPERWKASCDLAAYILIEAGVNYIPLSLSKEGEWIE